MVKSYRRWRIVGVKHRVVFGTQLAIEQVLAACGWTINTAFIERLSASPQEFLCNGVSSGILGL